MIIDLSSLKKDLFVGYSFGQSTRKNFNIDFLDNQLSIIEIIIPEETYSISSSFVRGLLEESLAKFNTKQDFYNKFHFKCNSDFLIVINCIVDRTFNIRNLSC